MYESQEMLLEELVRMRNDIQNGEKRYNRKILKKMVKIEIQLLSKELSPSSIIKYRYNIIDLKEKLDSQDQIEKDGIISKSIYIILAFQVMIIMFKHSTVPGSVEAEVFTFLSLAIIGFLGVLTHLYTRGFKKTDSFEFRALLGIIFPVIFLNIFLLEEGKIVGFEVVNLVIFIGGYSAEFFFGLLNKMVEVAGTTVNIKPLDKD